MKMQILGINGDEIKACAKFEYKGYEISFSTILPSSAQVAVYGDEAGDPLTTCATIAYAIMWIDENPTLETQRDAEELKRDKDEEEAIDATCH